MLPPPAPTPPDGIGIWACPGSVAPLVGGVVVEIDAPQLMVTRPLPLLMVPVLASAVRVGEAAVAAAKALPPPPP
ncbi:MAG: hypothetical protein WAN20_09250, partial [Pseudonocardiaceae bacterium]